MKNKKEYTGDYLSLYDYLGHGEGAELALKIADEAAECKVNIKFKSIDDPVYHSKVHMYPSDFLDECKDKELL